MGAPKSTTLSSAIALFDPCQQPIDADDRLRLVERRSVADARQHAAGLTQLLQRVREGVDANRNGSVEATRMEGGLTAAIGAAARAGLQSR